VGDPFQSGGKEILHFMMVVLSSIRIGAEWMIIKMGYVFKHVVAVCNAIDVTL
jgi:hypothetical protein